MIGKPIAFRVLIKPDEFEAKTKSGLILAVDKKLEDGATETGTVVAIGPDVYAAFKTRFPYGGLKVGQKVVFAKYAGKWVKIDEKKYLVMNDEDIVMELIDDNPPNVEAIAS